MTAQALKFSGLSGVEGAEFRKIKLCDWDAAMADNSDEELKRAENMGQLAERVENIRSAQKELMLKIDKLNEKLSYHYVTKDELKIVMTPINRVLHVILGGLGGGIIMALLKLILVQ